VYSYDAVGCFEKMKYTVSGSGQALIEPFLDNMVAYKNTDKKPATER
jgi:20S proteasome alpha/beta subunit